VFPDDVFVLDATVHAYNFAEQNVIGGVYANSIIEGVYGFHTAFAPAGRADLVLKRDVFLNQIADPDVTAGFLFRESHTDACIYHELPLYGYFKDGGSPLPVAVAMREKWPDRVLIYGAISPHQPNALERVDYLVEEIGVSGLKLYPHDLVAGELRSIVINDQDLLYPIFERAAFHRLRTIAIHKALVMGPVPIDPYYVNDIGDAARAFPDLRFEIVHGGFAFLEETAYLVQHHPNVTVSLEATSALLFKAPWKFAEIIGTLIDVGAADRIIWALGGAALHSRAFEERMWTFEIPQELQERYGLPPLTDEIKRGILGENGARILGIDSAALRSNTDGDEFAKPRELEPAWSCLGGDVATLASEVIRA
jgi:uncharacterized protein